MRGAVGSLNAAVAGSILLFEAVAQRDLPEVDRRGPGAARAVPPDEHDRRRQPEADEPAAAETEPRPSRSSPAPAGQRRPQAAEQDAAGRRRPRRRGRPATRAPGRRRREGQLGRAAARPSSPPRPSHRAAESTRTATAGRRRRRQPPTPKACRVDERPGAPRPPRRPAKSAREDAVARRQRGRPRRADCVTPLAPEPRRRRADRRPRGRPACKRARRRPRQADARRRPRLTHPAGPPYHSPAPNGVRLRYGPARRADVAQLVEQRFCKPPVSGSSPVVGSSAHPSGGRIHHEPAVSIRRAATVGRLSNGGSPGCRPGPKGMGVRIPPCPPLRHHISRSDPGPT